MKHWLKTILMLALAGCHAPSAAFRAGPGQLCNRELCYEVGPLGTSWSPLRKEGMAASFFNRAGASVIQSNASCRDDSDAAPLPTLTRHLLIGYTDRKVQRQSEEVVAARAALRTIVNARLDGVPMVLDLYVLKRNGCIFDLSLAAPPEQYAQQSCDFGAFVAGFRDLRSPR